MALTRVKGSVWDSKDNNLFVSLLDLGAKGDGLTNDSSVMSSAQSSAGGKVVFVPKTTSGYAVQGTLTLTGNWVFEEGAFLKCTAETRLVFDGDSVVENLYVDCNSQTVTESLVYLKSGNHHLTKPKITNIKGLGVGAYGIKINVEGDGKVTRIISPYFQQITDSRSGGIVGLEGFCGGIWITTDTGSTMAANGRSIFIEDTYGQDIYTTQADAVTENTADNDSDLIRFFVNDATSAAFINTVSVNIDGVVSKAVQKRTVKISGCGNCNISNVSGYGTRVGSQMSDIVFVADSRNVRVTGIKGFQKFDNVVKLDGTTFDADYLVSDVTLYSSQANVGTGVYAASMVGLKVDGVQSATDCERLLRYADLDRSETTNIKYNGTKTGTSPLIDIQNCDDLKLSYEVVAAFSGASGQIVYIQGSNRAAIDGIGTSTFAGAGGQNIRYNNCTYLTVTGYNESNKYNIFDEGTNTFVKIDQWVKQTGTNQPISIAATDWLELNCRQLTGDFTGVNMTAGVVALSGVDHFKVTGIYQALNMTDASNDRGILLTSCTRGTVDVETFTGASDPEMVRLSSCSKVYIKSISDSTKPVRILNTCTDIALQSFGPGAATNDAGAETTVINNVSTW